MPLTEKGGVELSGVECELCVQSDYGVTGNLLKIALYK